MRVLVCGGREYRDARHVAVSWAFRSKIKTRAFPADWDTYGRAAGFMRNIDMLVEGLPDLVVGFPGGAGTAHMLETARQAGFPVRRIFPPWHETMFLELLGPA